MMAGAIGSVLSTPIRLPCLCMHVGVHVCVVCMYCVCMICTVYA